jgi:DNA-binding HxlR family transcriptional regulator
MCPKYEKAFEVLGRRWTGLVLRALMDGPRRFSEITAYVPGLSDRLLSERLQELEAAGLVERHVHPAQRPVLVEYRLTDKGLALRPSLEALQKWADKWVAADATAQR